MVTLKQIKGAGDNLQLRSDLVMRWSEERGFRNHPICTYEHMRYIEELEEALQSLHHDCLASDFNEHWESYRAVSILLAKDAT